ncbi:SMC-Scp complex subunit ScpB [soil metagenome]
MSIMPLKYIVEAALLAADEPLSLEQLQRLFPEDMRPATRELREVIMGLQQECDDRGVELKELASGYCYQVKQSLAPWVIKLWETQQTPRYSRALLETLALIAYRQPITRAEIEKVRGVSVSTNITKALLDRGWIKIVGHRDLPGKPSLYATTREFLDYFNLKSLEELPELAEPQNLDQIEASLP